MRKVISRKNSLLIAFLIAPFLNFAQSSKELIQEIQTLMTKHYVFLDKAEETNEHLNQLMEKDFFASFKDPKALAKAVTEQMRTITKDKHLSMVAPQQAPVSEAVETPLIQSRSRYYTPMLNEYKYFENNVGYFDMRYFGGGSNNYLKIDAIMEQLAQADAFIIDMRKNGGGSPTTVQYLCSYFFDSKFLLNTIYTRATDHSEELWVVEVNGKKRPKVPVYILTSQRTFSGAEDFSYTMQQHNNRATIIGESTGGGAHPTRYFPLANGFGVRIPFARTINPVTKTNWEGVGVIPDIKIAADEALDKAKELASVAALKYKKSFFNPLETTLAALEGKKMDGKAEQSVFQLLDKAVKAGMLDENDINTSGYNYLLGGKTNAALAIFKSNTLLFPNSANVYDSYAEVLAGNGQTELALLNYNKAVALAKEQNHRNLEAFQENLKSFKKRSK